MPAAALATSSTGPLETMPNLSKRHSTSTEDDDEDEGIEEMLTPALSRQQSKVLARRVTTAGTTGTTDPRYEVDWEGDDDPNNPLNWSNYYKAFIIFTLSFSTLVVVYYSTSYTAGISQMMEEFNIQSEAVGTLGLTTYLIGMRMNKLRSRRPTLTLSRSCSRYYYRRSSVRNGGETPSLSHLHGYLSSAHYTSRDW